MISRDKFVYGILNNSGQEKLLAEEDFTLTKAVHTCRFSVQASKQLKEFKSEKSSLEVDHIDRGKFKQKSD